MADDIDRRGTEHVVVSVGKRLGRSHHNRVASVDAEGIKILHDARMNFIQEKLTYPMGMVNVLPCCTP